MLHDTFTSGGGKDLFVYTDVHESQSITFDTITDASFPNDRFDVQGTITGEDSAITAGTLDDTSQATFDLQLGIAMSGHLLARHFCLYTPNDGTLSGRTFLIVDQNILAGYQSGADLVIEITGFTGTPTTFSFI